MIRLRHLPLILFCLMAFMNVAGCAATKAQTGDVVSPGSNAKPNAVSQKKDPSLIYGDAALNEAYDNWAKNGYPVHPDSGKYDLNGKASWYGPGLNGNKTASGEIFDMYGMTAAHKKLPFGSIVVVTNLDNNKSVVVRINDRGPFVKGRVIDLSYGAAYLLDMVRAGVVNTHVEIIRLGK